MSGNLREAVAAAVREARRAARPRWVALRAELAGPRAAELDFGAAADLPEGFVWERPAEGRALAGCGAAAALETSGPDRFEVTASRARELFAALRVAGEPAPEAAGPLLVGAFAFDDADPAAPHWADFPAARLVLPEFLVSRVGGRTWCTAVRRIAPEADAEREARALEARLEAGPRALRPEAVRGAPACAGEYRAVSDQPVADYCARVESALEDIGAGDLEKVVVARSVRIRRPLGFEPSAILASLRRSHPSCTSFAVARPGGVFLGATPERLVRLEGDRVETSAVAGSAPRGRSPEEDTRLGRELSESKKEQAEHAVVVRALREALAPCCAELRVDEAPRLLQLEGIQHLDTRIRGTLTEPLSVVELAGRVHPTPAVAGAPRDRALAWLARREGLDRGPYAGPVGFAGPSGSGEFCVALRSALVRGGEARLFAGAGIVAGSAPEAELRETRLKLGALVNPLLEL